MDFERPDLSQTSPEIRAYIEALETELESLRRPQASTSTTADLPPLETDEPPTTLNVITVSRSGLAKRTPRHLYSRQRRGGMGIFDLETPDDDPPTHLLVADESHDLLLITTQARAFRVPVNQLPESQVRSKGSSLLDKLALSNMEQLALVVPHKKEGYLAVVTEQAHVRRFRYHYFRDDMEPGLLLFDTKDVGQPIAAGWSSGSEDLFIATKQGKAIRFSEQKITTMGNLGIRLSTGDSVVGIVGVNDKSRICLLSSDGKGTVRLMSTFTANKAPGAGGKAALKSDDVIGIAAVGKKDDVFAISRLSKIIRFQAAEIPPKDGIVQGVNCMALRADEVVAVSNSQ